MEQDEWLLHASSFGVAATAYAEHRPDYAQAAVRWALEPSPGLRVKIHSQGSTELQTGSQSSFRFTSGSWLNGSAHSALTICRR